ncbi:hypothetical protein A3I56_00285 [Candidatus Roizmanbacteria bacterium RIFCSPLOWO2_02_FULL_43_10]|uniref:Uncharacterized protein n=3 Tax=Candidatus Roizmaniibacteriota TaxID=1752723 RepID=A0A1F7JU92_9BACT|nr:MAG: hypothetical protein A3D08_00620 [Candidatus Roizmanbacteria bacterium RIFCSPHIGHO2_02_FULL_43_11]OGK38663.1 MAG: hypothetical protein A3F32_02555 [Candidatus Roizmanbacteria bacterium RIFCSPHIGHO2_12_FULL_42_10]OGK59160.1 MAG: hypothetical protein A3I56_00285 [Candidatus Roizmanbacteria bacterium RIFCSPLOWO2_02_FULL_43_10]
MDLITFAAVSALIIMVWHFAMNTQPSNFGLLQMIGIFILGGAIGWYMQSIEVALMFSIALSLLFIH